MTEIQQKIAAKEFSARWKDYKDEDQGRASFWLDLLQSVYGVEQPTQFIQFEVPVKILNTGNVGHIDGYIPETRVLVEQKGGDVSLRKGYKQSDGAFLTPYQQARRYGGSMKQEEAPKWIVVCNFWSFEIHNMNRPNEEPEIILLENLEEEYYRLQFLVDMGNEHIRKEMQLSMKAGDIVGNLYNAFSRQFADPESPRALHSLNVLCVRLVFCLYAENGGVFGKYAMFHDYMADFKTSQMRKALIELFEILDTKPEDRDPYLKDDNPTLAAFPYVNGGLFSSEDNIEIPPFTEEIRELLLDEASAGFNWSAISPTIFGAVFESTLNPETRRAGGMHYTSIENIHKVIDPLFLDKLEVRFEEICNEAVDKTRDKKLREFQSELASLYFLDPACGSGNFLTEGYLSLRRLENRVIAMLLRDQVMLGEVQNPIRVSISQFYGIEINDFAVTVAKTALWIAESQMMTETKEIVRMDLDFLPLKTNANIVEGNALRMDWENVVPKDRLDYIMGNPPFVGQALRNPKQSEDMIHVFGKGAPETKLDYVICWYKKAIRYMHSTKIECAFISTNSICQGESVPTFWKSMVEDGAEIQFAVTSFPWINESINTASVYCVIVGFTSYSTKEYKKLYSETSYKTTKHINGYLVSAPDIWLISRSNKSNNFLPRMVKGSEPTDGGNFFLSKEEKEEFIKKYPDLQNLIAPFIGGKEFIEDKVGNYSRYCFWLKNIPASMYNKNQEIMRRLQAIKELREQSSADRIRKRAEYPYLFCQDRQPDTTFLVFPRHSTASRKYIPIGFENPIVIVGDACYIIPELSIYHFGVLTSNVHMAWMRAVCGRLGMGYRYTPAIYNNFPWPSPTDAQRIKIEQSAQGILDARDLFPNSSLADLYDEVTMPPELRTAHQRNDKAVMAAYGWTSKDEAYSSESACVAELMKMYQRLCGD